MYEGAHKHKNKIRLSNTMNIILSTYDGTVELLSKSNK
jgi:hypothetical protein